MRSSANIPAVSRWHDMKQHHYKKTYIDIGQENGLSEDDAKQLAEIMSGFTVE
jgi:RecJ-like exonuclease